MDPNNRHYLLTAILTVAVFLLLVVPFSVPLLLSFLASGGFFFGYGRLAKPRLRIGVIKREQIGHGEDLQALMRDAAGDMEAILAASQQIAHTELRQQIQQLHGTGVRIMGYLNSHPNKITTARKFLGYYLDTSRNVVEKYRMLEESKLETAEVQRVRESTVRTMPILNAAFERQFTKLMANDIMDIEADLKLLETSLKLDGEDLK